MPDFRGTLPNTEADRRFGVVYWWLGLVILGLPAIAVVCWEVTCG